MRKICSSSSLCALSTSTAPNWHLGSADHQLHGFVGSCGPQQFLIAPATSAPPYHNVPPLCHKAPAADESVLWTLQRHLQLMPSSYAEAGFSIEEMLHHIRIFKEMQNGRKLGLLITSSRSKLPPYIVSKDAPTSKLTRLGCNKLNADTSVQVKSSINQPARQLIEIHFADHRVHSHSTALEVLGLQQLVAEDHVKVKKVQIFQRSREGLGVLAIARIKLSTGSGNLHDSIKGAKGSWIKALQSYCSYPVSKASAPFFSSTHENKVFKAESESSIDEAALTVACIDRQHDWTTGYAGGGFVNELLKKWWVNGDELRLSCQIGVGASGAVYEGICRGNTKVAVKLINNSHDSHFRRELLALGSLTAAAASANNNIVPLVGACRNSLMGRCVVITKFMEGGSLHAYLQKQPRLHNKRILELAMDIAKGMLYLHSRGIVHMDLKSPNIFLDKDGCPMIGDLGCARAVNEKELARKVDTGTYRWMAPEAFGEEGGVVAATPMMDVYSYGMVLWELVSGEVPWAGKSPVQAAAAVVLQRELRPPIPARCFPPFACLIRKCWAQNPADRPSFAHILRMLRVISAR